MPGLFDSLKREQAWQARYELSAPKPGDVAPDFALQDVHGAAGIKLSSMIGEKPVALVFGSFT